MFGGKYVHEKCFGVLSDHLVIRVHVICLCSAARSGWPSVHYGQFGGGYGGAHRACACVRTSAARQREQFGPTFTGGGSRPVATSRRIDVGERPVIAQTTGNGTSAQSGRDENSESCSASFFTALVTDLSSFTAVGVACFIVAFFPFGNGRNEKALFFIIPKRAWSGLTLYS